MPVGFYLLNDGMITQVDSTYKNIHLVRQGSVAFTGPSNLTTATITGIGANEIAVVRCNRPIRLMRQYGTPRTQMYLANGGSGDLQYWIFGFPDITASSWGMQVFDATPKLVFDALFPPMAMSDSFFGYDGVWPPNVPSVTTSLPVSSKQYGVIFTGSGFGRFSHMNDPLNYETNVYEDFARTTDRSVINTPRYSFYTTSSPFTDVNFSPNQGFAVDLYNVPGA